jgi:hypothetical protein
MNTYGRRAQQYYREFLPTRYQEIEDPAEYFTRLGQEMSEQINALALSLAGDDPAGESYLEKVGRLRMARQQAEDQVFRQTLPASDENETTSR